MSVHEVKIGRLDQLPDGGRLSEVLNDEVPVLVLRVGESLYCVEDVCTHDGQPMTDGEFVDCRLTCPRHGAEFDVRTGAALKMPATEPVRTFPVEVRNGEIYVTYED